MCFGSLFGDFRSQSCVISFFCLNGKQISAAGVSLKSNFIVLFLSMDAWHCSKPLQVKASRSFED